MTSHSIGEIEDLRRALGNPSRRLTDTAWLEVLGYEGDSDRLLDRPHSSLTKEIELPKGILAEGQQEEEQEEETE
nr:hypothetical protein [Candidatus Njordarchaeota archaeon]